MKIKHFPFGTDGKLMFFFGAQILRLFWVVILLKILCVRAEVL